MRIIIKLIALTLSLFYLTLPLGALAVNTHSIYFDSAFSQYAQITDASQTGLDLSTDFTIEAWINLESLPSASDQMHIVAKMDDNGYGYRLFINTDNQLWAQFHSGTAATTFKMDDDFAAGDLNTWIHIAAVADISVPSFTFYKNGSVSAGTSVATGATTINNNNDPFAIGAWNDGVDPVFRYFDGKLDEVRVWSDIRTAMEVLNNYNIETTDTGNSIAYYKFNNSALDETTNNNDLTLVNSPVYSTDIPFGGAVEPEGWEFYEVN